MGSNIYLNLIHGAVYKLDTPLQKLTGVRVQAEFDKHLIKKKETGIKIQLCSFCNTSRGCASNNMNSVRACLK